MSTETQSLPGRLHDVREVAELLNCSAITVRRAILRGDLESVRIGPKLLRVRDQAVQALVARGVVPARKAKG